MSMEEKEDTTVYEVVVTHEEQCSIWPAERENPLDGALWTSTAQGRNAWLLSMRSGPI